MSRSPQNPWLTRFAFLTAAATLALIGVGGLVTSHGVGMAVPDWPTTYGYNMFLFPISKWVGGIFYEHSHRLVASGVGLMTTILAVWLWVKESRPGLRWLGVAAFFLVVLQGVLGGLRVTLFKDQIGLFHATLAQIFLVVICAIALFTTRWWQQLAQRQPAWAVSGRVRLLVLVSTLAVFGQLLLGASMRHQHAGLAVPDFPLAHGKLWPATDPASVEAYNRARLETRGFNPITAGQIRLHLTHRLGAVLVLALVGACAWATRREVGGAHPLARLAAGWLGLICLQAVLGAVTVWSNKAADIATLHVVVGAVSLSAGALLTLVVRSAAGVATKSAGEEPAPAPAKPPSALAAAI